jgi:predicted phage tail protein
MGIFEIGLLIFSLVLAVVSYFLTPQAKKPKNDQKFEVPVAKEGKTIGVLYGTELIKDLNVVNYWGLRIVADSKSGGKKQ